MIKHTVMWRLNGATPAERTRQAHTLKAALESLNGRIPGLRRLEVGVDVSNTPNSAHLVLISELDDADALAAYQAHPEHVKVAEQVKAATSERYLVDYQS